MNRKVKQILSENIEKLNDIMGVFIDLINDVSASKRNIEDTTRSLKYDDDVENYIANFLDILIENSELCPSDSIIHIQHEYNGIYLSCDSTMRGLTTTGSERNGSFNIGIDFADEVLIINGNTFDNNGDQNSDFHMRIRYRRIGDYVDKLIDLKHSLDKKRLMSNINSIYDISGLNRVKSLKDMGI